MNRNYDVCIFDLDGTLIDSLEDLADSCNIALEVFDLPQHDIDEYRYFVGTGILNLIKNSMGKQAENLELVQSVYNTFNIIYEEKCLNKTIPYHGITEMLGKLKSGGVKLGVLSNKADPFAKRIVSELFGGDLIDMTFGQQKGFRRKPEPESLYYVIEKLGSTPERCLYVGDSGVDVTTALNAGVDFCGAEWGFRGYDELKDAGALTIVKSPAAISGIVLS